MLADNELKSSFNTVSGEARVATIIDSISINFKNGAVSYNTREQTSGYSTITNEGGSVKLSLGNVAGSAILYSKDTVRFTSGHEASLTTTHSFAIPTEDVKQMVGVFDTNDGVAFGCKGEEFGIWYSVKGVHTFISSKDFNVNKLDEKGYHAPLVKPEEWNDYRISYGGGSLPIYFSIFTGWEAGWQLVHVLEGVVLANASLPLATLISRSGIGGSVSMRSKSWRAGSATTLASLAVSDRYFSYNAMEQDIPSGQDTAVLLIRSKDVYLGGNNTVQCKPTIITAISHGVHPVLIAVITNPLIADPIVWEDTDTENSTCEFATGAFEVLGAIPKSSPMGVLNKDDKGTVQINNLILHPKDTIAIVALSTAHSNITVAMTIREEF